MNFELDEAQSALQDAAESLLARYVTKDTVRRADEANGFDEQLWMQQLANGMPTLAVSEKNRGGGGTLLDLAIAVEQCGRVVAPTPLVEVGVAARLAERLGANDLLQLIIDGSVLPTVAVLPVRNGVGRLIPAGAIADVVLLLDNDDLVAVTADSRTRRHRRTLGSEPVADWATSHDAISSRITLDQGVSARRAWQRAVSEWKALCAAQLVGIATGVLELTVQYTRDRRQFGAPISAFQVVAHKFADASTEIEACRLLCREAAWIADERPESLTMSAAMAFGLAAETANRIAQDCLHLHGGYGYMLEYDVQLFFRKAKARALLAGNPQLQYSCAADIFVAGDEA